MDSPRSGHRRAAAASWALVGLGVAGVAGGSALAFADTYKPQAAEQPVATVEPAPPEPAPPPVVVAPPPVPQAPTTTDDPPAPPPPSQTTVEPAPETREAPEYTPKQTYEQAPTQATQTYEPAPAPATHAPSTPPTTRRRNLTPTTVMAPNFSPHVTVSRGS